MSKRSRREARHRRESKTIQAIIRFNEKRGMPAAVSLEIYSEHKVNPPAFIVAPKTYVQYLINLIIARIDGLLKGKK